MKKQFIETGKIVGTHGVRGEMRAEAWCDMPSNLTKYKKLYLDAKGENALDIKGARVHKNIVLLTADGINSIEDAERLRGRTLFVARKDLKLKKGAYLIVDLIGCRVLDNETGEALGEICDVSETGANDVWHIKKDGKEYLIPVIDSVVNEVDIDAETVKITPMKGLFDDED
ncbi:MAG: ribosome maturation factor RimM [Clostridia bacterium]|nr:ribosome maturation factor RimM [Clostridia bacterium]